jgi:hypothetical protein
MMDANLGTAARARLGNSRSLNFAQGAQVVERGTAKQDAELDAKHNLFGRAYARWLRARAVIAWAARFKALDDAERTLLVTPPLSDEMLWQKWEVLESFVSCDAIAGQATDNRAIMALGCIKADLMRLGCRPFSSSYRTLW